jgi:riboflavin synthase
VFTGLIEEVGEVRRTQPRGGGLDVVIRATGMAAELAVGESVSINGACLTVECQDQSTFTAHAGEETLHRTTLREVRPGVKVNLERALMPGSRLGGHFVQGHVDGVGRLSDRRPAGSTVWFEFEAPPELAAYIAPKGSIAVDGISLTVVECAETRFSVAIIPHTLDQTTLGLLSPGDRVNLEVDVLAKYVARLLAAGQATGEGLTAEYLREQGF